MAILGKSLNYQWCFPYPPVGCWIKSKNRKLRETVHPMKYREKLLLIYFCRFSQFFLQKDSETPHFRTTLNTSSHPLPILFPSSSHPIRSYFRVTADVGHGHVRTPRLVEQGRAKSILGGAKTTWFPKAPNG